MRFAAGAVAHAELRPIQNVVAPMNTSATFWNRLRFVQLINDNGVMASGPHAYAIDRDLFAFVAKPTKPEALNEMTFSAMAWVDDGCVCHHSRESMVSWFGLRICPMA